MPDDKVDQFGWCALVKSCAKFGECLYDMSGGSR